MAGNIFQTGMDALNNTYVAQRAMGEDRARMRAGRALASGNRSQAAQEFGQAGLTDDVRAVQGDEIIADRYKRNVAAEDKDEAYKGAELFISTMGRITDAIGQIPLDPDGGQTGRRQALEQLSPILERIVPDEKVRQQIMTSDLGNQTLSVFKQKLAAEWQVFQDKHGITAVNKRDPNQTVDVKEYPDEPLIVPQTSDVFMPQPRPQKAPSRPTAGLAGGIGDDTLGGDTIAGSEGVDAMEGGAGRDIPGYSLVRAGRPPQGRTQAPPSGYRWAKGGGLEAIPGGPADPKNLSARDTNRTFTQEQQLRAQYGNRPQIKDLASVQSHVRTIGTIAKKASSGQKVTAADDVALIFAFMKMLDPGSVVREGEFATAQNTAGIPARVQNLYNRAMHGTRLTNEQRAEFFNTATTAMDSYTNGAADQSDWFRTVAGRYELNPDNIAPAITRPPARGGPAKPVASGNGWKVIKVH